MRPLTIVFLLRTFSLLCNRNESAFQVVLVVGVVKNVILVLIIVKMTAIRIFPVVWTSSSSFRDNGGHAAADDCLLEERSIRHS